MPYRRNAYRKRRRFAKRRFNRAKKAGWSYSNAFAMAKSALSQIWKIKGLINSEMFKLDSTSNIITIDGNTPASYAITNVAQGDGEGQRTGNSIFCRAYNLKGYLVKAATPTNTMVRIAVIMDIQQVGDTAPTWSNIYESTSVNAHLNSDTVGRYKILFNRLYRMDTSKINTPVFINIAMRHHVRYNGTASTDIQKGGLWLLVSSDQTSTSSPTFVYDSRLSYHDN